MANRKTATQMLAEACGKPFDEVLQDSSRTFYMSPDEAVEYGLIDKVRNPVYITASPIPTQSEGNARFVSRDRSDVCAPAEV